ncbi:5-methylthioadenosine/S-adenosylhomocysteine deaminase [Actinocorallia herbida]|uniref:5-methylthioadenosine/S-adenosylhomocysteine deaminase n=1 Tax=Actinocorallia herbida TaxID=58109 RepID=A0A3N1CSZ3_9ACTN|nr:amidohydrolase family protein [Actinocorallia herbida]ROO84431.1 5-methylthioadenosine/S-adenosylhomocysteine deaminase [Actinocorallia herbida]
MAELIVADHVFVNDGEGTVLSPGAVEVADGRILSAGAVTGPRPSGQGVTDLGARVVLPGLVNAHAHTPMSLMRGTAEGHSLLSMEGFLTVLRSREEHLTPDLVPASVAVSCGDMIRHGTTAFADQYFYADEIAPTVERSGLRARIAWGIVELGDDTARARELAAATRFAESLPPGGRVSAWVGPHAYFVDNTPEAMAAELALARRLDAGLHVHFATSGEEEKWCHEHYGRSALEVLRDLGMLDVPTILAHCTTVPVDQLPLLAGTRAAMTVIPSVAMMSGVPAAPVRAALDHGVLVALGSDNVCNNTNTDLFEEMRTLGKLAAFTSRVPDQVTSREILEIATVGGHRALAGGPDDGRLVAGAVADLIAVPVTEIARGPVGAQSLEAALVYGTSGASVTHSMADGAWLMADRAVRTLDLAAAARRQQADYDILSSRMHARGTRETST